MIGGTRSTGERPKCSKIRFAATQAAGVDDTRASVSQECAAIAHHYCEAASAVKAEDTADWAERAGFEAAQQLAFAEAAEWYARAIDLRTATDKPCTADTLFAFALACDGAKNSRARKLRTSRPEPRLATSVMPSCTPTSPSRPHRCGPPTSGPKSRSSS